MTERARRQSSRKPETPKKYKIQVIKRVFFCFFELVLLCFDFFLGESESGTRQISQILFSFPRTVLRLIYVNGLWHLHSFLIKCAQIRRSIPVMLARGTLKLSCISHLSASWLKLFYGSVHLKKVRHESEETMFKKRYEVHIVNRWWRIKNVKRTMSLLAKHHLKDLQNLKGLSRTVWDWFGEKRGQVKNERQRQTLNIKS